MRQSLYTLLQSSKTDTGGSKDGLGQPKEREEIERESKVEIKKDVGVFG